MTTTSCLVFVGGSYLYRDFSRAGHAEDFPCAALDDEGVGAKCVDFVSEALIVRVKVLDLSRESAIVVTRLQEAEDAAITKKRVQHRECDDEKRGEPERFLLDLRLAETSRPRRVASSAVVSRSLDCHIVDEL